MRKTFLVVLCAICLGVASPAFASSTSPTQGAYSGQGAQQVSRAQSARSVSGASASSLPFTGLNVGALCLVAVGMLGTGLVLRRRIGSDRS